MNPSLEPLQEADLASEAGVLAQIFRAAARLDTHLHLAEAMNIDPSSLGDFLNAFAVVHSFCSLTVTYMRVEVTGDSVTHNNGFASLKC